MSKLPTKQDQRPGKVVFNVPDELLNHGLWWLMVVNGG